MKIFEELISKIGKQADERHIITDLAEFYEVLSSVRNEAETKAKAAIEKLKRKRIKHPCSEKCDCFVGTYCLKYVDAEQNMHYNKALEDVEKEIFGDDR